MPSLSNLIEEASVQTAEEILKHQRKKPFSQTRLPLPSFLPSTGSFRARRSLPSSGEEGNCTYSRRRSDPGRSSHIQTLKQVGNQRGCRRETDFPLSPLIDLCCQQTLTRQKKKVPTILTAPTFRLKTVCIGTTALHWRGASQRR